jgi:hypothetical protein
MIQKKNDYIEAHQYERHYSGCPPLLAPLFSHAKNACHYGRPAEEVTEIDGLLHHQHTEETSQTSAYNL